MSNKDIYARLKDLEDRVSSLEEAVRPINEFNMGCDWFSIRDGEPHCRRGMDLTFCSPACAIASNRKKISVNEYMKGNKNE